MEQGNTDTDNKNHPGTVSSILENVSVFLDNRNGKAGNSVLTLM